MLKKRLIGMITVKDDWAVQSFGYKRYLPLGKPQCLIENLDRWGADEIIIQVIDRSKKNIGPDFKLLESIGKLGLETPLIYGGGIRTVEDSVELIQLGADRLIVDSLLHDDLICIKKISDKLGSQAIIASLPLACKAKNLDWFNYRTKTLRPLSDKLLDSIQSGVISEVLISDWQHEGMPDSFDQELINLFPIKHVPIILFGGISDFKQMDKLLNLKNINAIAVGNFLSYKEHAIQSYKKELASLKLRSASYKSSLFIGN